MSHLANQLNIQYFFLTKEQRDRLHPKLERPYFSLIQVEHNLFLYRVEDRPDVARTKPVFPPDSNSSILLQGSGGVLTAVYARNFYPSERHDGCERARWMSDQAELHLRNTADLSGTLSFSALPVDVKRNIQISLDGRFVGEFSVPKTGRDIKLDVPLPIGDHTLLIDSVEDPVMASEYGPIHDPRTISFKLFHLRFVPAR